MDKAGLIKEKQIIRTAEVILQIAKTTNKLDISNPLEEKPIVLQFGFKKIPNVQNQVIKILLPVTVTHSTTDICLFTNDLDKTNRDYEPTIRHYRDLLAAAGIDQQINIIPYKCLVLEYQPYEAKRNLSNMYDIFLADDRIAHRLPTLLGKNFLARKKYPIRVNLTTSSLKKEIEKALSSTQCVVTGRGSTCQVSVARTGMTAEQITMNVKATITKLTESLPGGCDNIRNIHIKTSDSPSLPIYVSLDKRDGIKLPKKKMISQETEPEEVTTVENALVKITKSGRILLVNRNDDEASFEESCVNQMEDSKEVSDETNVESLHENSPEEDDDTSNKSSDDEVTSKRKRAATKMQKGRKKRVRTLDPEKCSSNGESGSDQDVIGRKVKAGKGARKGKC